MLQWGENVEVVEYEKSLLGKEGIVEKYDSFVWNLNIFNGILPTAIVVYARELQNRHPFPISYVIFFLSQ